MSALNAKALRRLNNLGGPLDVTAATLTMTADEHANKTLVVDKADGSTITLPAATGSGNTYKVYIKTSITSNNLVLQAASSSDTFQGRVYFSYTTGGTVVSYESVAATDTITLDGGNSGGYKGGLYTFIDVASGEYYFEGHDNSSATPATPLSAAV